MLRGTGRPRGWDDAIGEAPRHLACLRALEARADGDAPVLLVGPAGAGKAHLAHLLARRGPRGRGTLVVVDAARLRSKRLEVVLFGHDLGSQGLSAFERAAGGTVLVRRIDLVPVELQDRLRRVLMIKRFRRDGAGEEVALDARVLFTAHASAEGRVVGLGPGLAAELEGALVRVPSLAERPGDAAELAARFVARALYARGQRSTSLTLSEVGRGLFERAVWDGGVAQLQEVVEELVARRVRGLRADQAVDRHPGPPAAPDDGPAPVDLATIRGMALAG